MIMDNIVARGFTGYDEELDLFVKNLKKQEQEYNENMENKVLECKNELQNKIMECETQCKIEIFECKKKWKMEMSRYRKSCKDEISKCKMLQKTNKEKCRKEYHTQYMHWYYETHIEEIRIRKARYEKGDKKQTHTERMQEIKEQLRQYHENKQE